MSASHYKHLFVPLKPDQLLEGKLFYPLDGQILFWHEEWQDYVITVISEFYDYTADDYKQLPEGAPYQLIHGKLVFMPSPFFKHQRISSKLNAALANYVYTNNLGEVVASPMDVEFDNDNVYQPDLLFVSIKRNNIIDRWIKGAPDFVVEIASISTENVDRTKKMEMYGRHNVLEYCIINPNEEEVEVYHNHNREMQHQQTATKDDTIISKAIEGLKMPVNKIFE